VPSVSEHYMQVSKWLGHSTFVLTLTTYADYIREDDTAERRTPFLSHPRPYSLPRRLGRSCRSGRQSS